MLHVLVTLVTSAAAAASCDRLNADILETENSGIQMLQRSLQALQGDQRNQGDDFFDFSKILADEPAGSFLQGMEVLVKANDLVYNTTQPLYDADLDKMDAFEAGGKSWQRLRKYDRDPKPGGVFARVFLEPDSNTLVIAFKGVCVEKEKEQCQMDSGH